jgi:hypothetical protein
VRTLALAVVLLGPSLAVAQTARQADPLATRSGLEVGAQVAGYTYDEPGVAKLSGNRLGIVGAATLTGESGLFGKIDFRESYGRLKYEGSGTMTGVPDLIFEVRALGGFDWIGAGVSLSPYLGLGYRYLYNDLTGYSSTGAAGYRRYSNYLYAPVGLTVRIALGAHWVLAPTGEVDVFIRGKQKSMLSDASAGLNDVTNTQKHGSGYRAYLMLENGNLAFGPWMHYWHIQDSDLQPIGGGRSGLEPENWTREIGVEFRYRF